MTNIVLRGRQQDLLRYVKPSHMKNGMITDELFQLREDRSPPEDYISFFYSKSTKASQKITDIKKLLGYKKFSPSCGFIFLNPNEALKEINITNKIIDFKEESYPHYGMYYISDDDMDITEAKTMLMYLSNLYLNSKGAELQKKS